MALLERERHGGTENTTVLPLPLIEPRVPQYFRNRRHEIDRALRAFSQNKWCAYYGVSGSGKTATAAKVASMIRTRRRAELVWLAIDQSIDTSVLLESLANSIGHSLRSIATVEQKKAYLRAVTENRGVYIVFDNVTTSAQLETLLSCVGEGNFVLITKQLEDPILAVKFDIEPIHLHGLLPRESTRVLWKLIGVVPNKISFKAWEQLVTDVGNLPIALEIVAGDTRLRSNGNPVQYIEEQIATGKWSEGQPALDRMRQSLAESVSQLPPEDAEAFCALGTFEGSFFTSEAVMKVCGLMSIGEAEDLLSTLRYKKLANKRKNASWFMHSYVRDFARQRSRIAMSAAETDHNNTPTGRHINYYFELLERFGGYEWNLKNYPQLIPHELEVIRSIDFAAKFWEQSARVTSGRYENLCIEMTWLVSWYLHWRGLWDLRIRLCRRVTDIAEAGKLPLEEANTRNRVGGLYVDRGWTHLFRGELDIAQRCADAGEKYLGKDPDAVFAQELQGQLAYETGLFDRAYELFSQLQNATTPGTRIWFVFSYRLSDTLYASGRIEAADLLLEKLLAYLKNPILVRGEIIDDVYGRIALRGARRRLGRHDDVAGLKMLHLAVKAFNRSGIITPERAEATAYLAELTGKYGSTEQHRSTLREALRQSRNVGDIDAAMKVEGFLKQIGPDVSRNRKTRARQTSPKSVRLEGQPRK